MAQHYWRLNRVRQREQQALLADPEMSNLPALLLLQRYATTFERAFYKALQTLRQLQSERRKQATLDSVPQTLSDTEIFRYLDGYTAPPTLLRECWKNPELAQVVSSPHRNYGADLLAAMNG